MASVVTILYEHRNGPNVLNGLHGKRRPIIIKHCWKREVINRDGQVVSVRSTVVYCDVQFYPFKANIVIDSK